MTIESLKSDVDKLNKSDLIRLYLYVNGKFDTLKKEDPVKTSKLLYGVKNPDKVKQSIYRNREKVKALGY
jgi:hypothetical protein